MTRRSTTGKTGTYDRVEPRDRRAWRRWLEQNHATSEGVWLVYRKKASGDDARLRYDAAVEEALCFGWIDSVVNRLDELRSLQLFSPRKPGGTWSKLNKERVARLVRDGKMTPFGQAKIDAAKRDGSWTVLDAIEALEVPRDLAAALRREGAQARFESFSPSVKKALLWWVASAKRPETRRRRIEELASHAAKGKNALARPTALRAKRTPTLR